MLLAIAACGDSGGDRPTSAGMITSATGLTSATTVTTGDPAGTTSGGGADTGVPTTSGAGETGAGETGGGADTGGLPKLDVHSDETTSGGQTTGDTALGCDKVDFLFVVDNSGSMADEQANLIASFPGFIATITDTLEAKDYHIMAVSTDDGSDTGLNSKCTNGDCTCTPAPVCCENACNAFGANTCNGFACDNLPLGACNYQFGTGKEFDADGKHCMLEGGKRYMKETQPNLGDSFACIANVGTYGSGDEKPMLATTEALGAKQNGPGGCDEGFLRDDAILVVTFITDEEDDNVTDDGSPGEPADWYDAIVAAKHGDPKAVVVLGLLGDGNLPGGVCPMGGDPDGDGAEDGLRLQSFVGMFPNGVVGSVCAPDYTPFFADAVSVIDLACDTFEPPK